MSNVIQIKPCCDPVATLREIADKIDRGEFEQGDWTIIGSGHIFHAGQVNDERAAEAAIFNMNFGIHKVMYAVVREE